MGKLLEWTDLRPTLLRAVGRSGVEYQVEQTESNRWMLTRFSSPGDLGLHITCGWLADMKALAEEHEADALGPAPVPQRIAWTRIRPGIYWGIAPVGLAYRISKLGIVEGATHWTLEQFPNEDAEIGTALDEGSLQSCKAAAARDATNAAKAHAAEEVGRMTSLTWFTAARERTERAVSKLRSLERDPTQQLSEEVLTEAADELRTAANHCDDSLLALRRERGEA